MQCLIGEIEPAIDHTIAGVVIILYRLLDCTAQVDVNYTVRQHLIIGLVHRGVVITGNFLIGDKLLRR